MPDDSVALIVGLGNPGEKYEETRHNAGFVALDHFAARHGQRTWSEKMKGLFCSFRFAGRKVLLLKPLTYMNRSGDCVQAYLHYFNVTLENILVIHDDLDLDNGRVKLVFGGGAGGHNGIRSLVGQLGTQEFARLKIGIGHPRNNEETASIPVERFVLSKFAPAQWQIFQGRMELISDGIELFVEGGIRAAMNSINRAAREAP